MVPHQEPLDVVTLELAQPEHAGVVGGQVLTEDDQAVGSIGHLEARNLVPTTSR